MRSFVADPTHRRSHSTMPEHELYCSGVGLVLAVDLATGDREQWVQTLP
jgi:hypothetical protein